MLSKLYLVDLNEWGFSTILELFLTHLPCAVWFLPHLMTLVSVSWNSPLGIVYWGTGNLKLVGWHCFYPLIRLVPIPQTWPAYLSIQSECDLPDICPHPYSPARTCIYWKFERIAILFSQLWVFSHMWVWNCWAYQPEMRQATAWVVIGTAKVDCLVQGVVISMCGLQRKTAWLCLLWNKGSGQVLLRQI